MFKIAISIIISYLIGSIPYGLILLKIFKGIDIREVGSKNIGATNVLRAGYKKLALVTLLLDLSKGAVASIIFKELYFPELGFVAGLFAIIGHNFPIWLNFKGGKGVATSLGTLLALNPLIGALVILTWLIIAILFKYSSLAAILAFTMLPIYSLLLQKNMIYFSLIISLLLIARHKTNIINLINGTESKINLKK